MTEKTKWIIESPKFSKIVFSKRLGRMELLLPDEHLCNYGSCLRCRFLNKGCMTIRAIYERRKAENQL